MDITDIKNELVSSETTIFELRDALKIDEKRIELASIEAKTLKQGFWDNSLESTATLKKVKELKQVVSMYDKVANAYGDAHVLYELSMEDDSMLKELDESIKSLKVETEKLRISSLLSEEYDTLNAIVTIHAGAGGTESQDWAEMLLRMYQKWCDKSEFEMEIYDIAEGDEAGIKSVTFNVKGAYAYGYLKSEKGVHRLIRISPFDSNKRRHTSFAAVDVMPEVDDSIRVEIRPEDLETDTYRASGAGGQHINKTESAVRIKHIPTGIVVSCQTERSQIQNRETCMKMLRSKLYQYELNRTQERLKEIKGELSENGWGSQIRSYVFCPYTMVKDHRTNVEVGNIQGVMDGNIDIFISEYLKYVVSDNKRKI